MENERQLHQSFRHDSWLASYPLNENTVLDYFAWSPFYDLNSINEQVKAQNLSAAAAAHLTGVEFQLRRTGQERAGLYVIEKRLRNNANEAAVPVTLYCVVEGTVFPSPDMGTLLAGRVARAAHHLSAAVALVEQARAASREAASAAAAAAGDDAGNESLYRGDQHSRAVDALLMSAASR